MPATLRPVAKCSPKELREASERAGRALFIAARHSRGWTQLEASTRLGVDRASVENWERGATRVPLWALLALERLAA